MNSWKTFIFSLNLVLVFIFFGVTVVKNENVLAKGQELYLSLYISDPRSLMQGDYMELRYALTEQIRQKKTDKENGYAVVNVSDGSLIRLQKDVVPVVKGEVAIRYVYDDKIWPKVMLSNHSFMFQEGNSHYYNGARYALVKVDKRGNIHVLHLCDSNKQILGPGKDE